MVHGREDQTILKSKDGILMLSNLPGWDRYKWAYGILGYYFASAYLDFGAIANKFDIIKSPSEF